MIATKRDARQKVNAITDVGPSNVWNYCGIPQFTIESQPDWFQIQDNKLTVDRSAAKEGIYKLDGTMNIGSLSKEGQIHAYVDTLVDC